MILKEIDELVEEEVLALQLHKWYLEAIKELNSDSFNKNAQKRYEYLTNEQKSIDRYIANKIMELIKLTPQKTKDRIEFLQNEIIKLQKYKTERVKKIRDDFIKFLENVVCHLQDSYTFLGAYSSLKDRKNIIIKNINKKLEEVKNK